MRNHHALPVLFALVGCLPAPAGPRPGAVPTGERVAVVDDVKTWTTTSTEKTGETAYRNADGEVVGTAEHYQERTHLHAKKVWYPVQGRQQLNDEDFFRITGDTASLEATRAMHATGRRYAAIGTAGMVVGIAAMIAARFTAGNTGVMLGLYCGGGIVGTAGAYGYWRGRELQSPDTHAVDRSLAEQNARRYNAELGRSPSVSIGGRF